MTAKNFPVIIPVKNRKELTQQTIRTLQENSIFHHPIFIVSDNSNKETNDYLKSIESDDIRVYYSDKDLGPGKARNIAMAMADDNLFYYHSDCDMYFLYRWDADLYTTYNEFYPKVGILGGRKHPHHGVEGTESNNGHSIIYSDQQVGMSLFFSYRVWHDVGKSFYENKPTEMGGEDTDFCNKAKEAGYKIASLQEPVVLHCGIKNTWNEHTAGHNEELKQEFPSDAIFL